MLHSILNQFILYLVRGGDYLKKYTKTIRDPNLFRLGLPFTGSETAEVSWPFFTFKADLNYVRECWSDAKTVPFPLVSPVKAPSPLWYGYVWNGHPLGHDSRTEFYD